MLRVWEETPSTARGKVGRHYLPWPKGAGFLGRAALAATVGPVLRRWWIHWNLWMEAAETYHRLLSIPPAAWVTGMLAAVGLSGALYACGRTSA